MISASLDQPDLVGNESLPWAVLFCGDPSPSAKLLEKDQLKFRIAASLGLRARFRARGPHKGEVPDAAPLAADVQLHHIMIDCMRMIDHLGNSPSQKTAMYQAKNWLQYLFLPLVGIICSSASLLQAQLINVDFKPCPERRYWETAATCGTAST
jgi:hypothetical protein